MAVEDEKIHIAMFPWLAFGHMMPWLELAKLMAQKGHKISFISTPRNIDRLPKPPPESPYPIHFLKLPLPQIEGLPQDAEATTDLPANKVQYLKKALDLLQGPTFQLLQSSNPDWIFFDFAPYWVGSIAAELGIKTAFFSICIASFLAFLGPPSVLIDGDGDYRKVPEDFTVPPKWVPFPTTVAYRYYDIKNTFDCVEQDVSGVNDLVRIGHSARSCDIVAVRSCSDFETEWLQVLEDIYRKPVFPVGQLPPSDYSAEDKTDAWKSIKEWLDKREKGSVVYVAFGSEAKPSQTQLTELSLGLELSGLPFFWVLRTRRGEADTELIELPPGFEERTKGRGVVCTSWAPQLKILAHDSVGGILTHSGWSSVVEALTFKKALILLTFYSDQGINARILEEKRIGYCIPRNELDGSFSADSVAESLDLVMASQEGRIYRDKAKEIGGLFGDKERQDKYVNNILSYLVRHRPTPKLRFAGTLSFDEVQGMSFSHGCYTSPH